MRECAPSLAIALLTCVSTVRTPIVRWLAISLLLAPRPNRSRTSRSRSLRVCDAPIPARPEPLREPPFHALEVQAAITFTHGGLRVDADGRVLDADGLGVPGLYAAGADAGGVHDVGYAGGLATALVFGRRAGRHAAAAARTTSITGGARP